jgi:hypothetical protein
VSCECGRVATIGSHEISAGQVLSRSWCESCWSASVGRIPVGNASWGLDNRKEWPIERPGLPYNAQTSFLDSRGVKIQQRAIASEIRGGAKRR